MAAAVLVANYGSTSSFFELTKLVCLAFRSIFLQFADVAHFQTLDFSSVWPAVTISDSSTATGGLTASAWNYGSDFGGNASTWTSGALTAHADTNATGGMFGTFGVDDENYGNISMCTDDTTPCRG